MDPTAPIFDKNKPTGRLMWIPIAFATFAVLGTIYITASAVWEKNENSQTVVLAAAAAWAILAPAWFFIEFHYFYRQAPGKDSWELFKHGQQVAIAVWAGVTAVLYAVGTSELVKFPNAQVTCTFELQNLANSTIAGSSSSFIIKCPK